MTNVGKEHETVLGIIPRTLRTASSPPSIFFFSPLEPPQQQLSCPHFASSTLIAEAIKETVATAAKTADLTASQVQPLGGFLLARNRPGVVIVSTRGPLSRLVTGAFSPAISRHQSSETRLIWPQSSSQPLAS